MVRGSGKVSMYEMWKREQIHEDARTLQWTNIFVKKLGKLGKTPSGRSCLRQKNGQTGRCIHMVQKVIWIRDEKNGTNACDLM